MNKLTFLTYEQLFGQNKLDIINKIGVKAAITDFSILLGGHVSNKHFTNEGKELKNRIGWYWLEHTVEDNDIPVLNVVGECSSSGILSSRANGARPTLQYSLISAVALSKVRKPDGILEIEYGYYPQWAPSHNLQKELEYALKTGTMIQLKNYIITDSRKRIEHVKEFKQQKHPIYEHKGKQYIRVKANPDIDNFILSNENNYKKGDYVWVEISPVKWLVDEENDIAVSKNILFAGVQFKNDRNYDGDFSKTDINMFMNTYLIKDLFKCNSIINTNNPTREQLLEEIKELKEKLEIATRKNNELKKENTNYKQRIRRIQDIIQE